ncbi:LPXTG cell wall anchor domain-containing protein [Demequina sp. NBRC 110054]|uniref:LPXTG cell wall anchor domain-containing protein n=1 Tax=Demequina sp. NBRC 110054 TaxID=1570343 RepID=UPI0009FCDF89|nr:LPXTG cell wall anchor domain-containing protein [Demequina sp. NBRC 110054]
MHATRTAARLGAIAALSLTSIAVVGTSAGAVDSDLTVAKSADASTVQAGDTVGFTVEVAATGDAEGVTVADTLPDGLTYVEGSSHLVFEDQRDTSAVEPWAAKSYTGGTGWNGPWVETDDDGSASGGLLQVVPFVGGLAAIAYSGTYAGQELERSLDIPADATSLTASFDTGSMAASDAGDQWTISLLLDGSVADSVVLSGASAAGTQTLTSAVSGESEATLLIHVDSFTGGFSNALWFGDVTVDVTVPPFVTSIDPAGAPSDLTNGASYDMTAGDTLTITYDATVDDVLAGDVTLLTNDVVVATATDAAAGQDAVTLTVTRHPSLSAAFTLPEKILVGDDIPVTIELSHASDSDGADVCDVLTSLAGTGLSLDSGDDGDGCLEYGETWVLTAKLSGMADSVGAGTLAFDASGSGVGQSLAELSEEVAYTVLSADAPSADDSSDEDASTDDGDTSTDTSSDSEADATELAETGPADAALGLAAGAVLVAGGLALLAARRRIALQRR